jgi:transposase
MAQFTNDCAGIEAIYMGVDVHRKSWQLTVRTFDRELKRMSIPPEWENLRQVIDSFGAQRTEVVYEAGYFGYTLHDDIMAHGSRCIVAPPSLIPQESGNRVKTDKRDSSKLARLLAKGEMPSIYVPTLVERQHREVLRHRQQTVKERKRVQTQIRAFLVQHGIRLAAGDSRWSGRLIRGLRELDLGSEYLRASLQDKLDHLEFLNGKILVATRRLRELSTTPAYQERVRLLRTAPGVGLITAMAVLLELQDMRRFRNNKQLAAYVGLTPSQYSSGDKVRMGHITGAGKSHLRGLLTEAAWMLIKKDPVMAQKFEAIASRSGSKRANIAVAHNLLARMRRMLLDGVPYSVGVVG